MKNGKCSAGQYYCYTDKVCKPIPKGFKMVGRAGYLRKENGHSVDDDNKNGNGSNGNGNGSNGNGNGGGVSESKSGDSSLRDWFGKSKSSDGKPGWVQLGGKYAGKPCAKQPGQTTKPKCGSSKMKRNLSKDEEQAAFRRKNAKDPNPNRSGKAINVKTEETKKDHEFSMARSEIKTIKNAASRLEKKMGKKGEGELKAWVQSKITKAADYIDTAADYVTNEEFTTLPLEIEVPTEIRDFNLGLMFRESLDINSGMLFIFDEVAEQSFHMRETKIPLDIAFITEEGIIESIKKLEPFDESSVASNGDVLCALEVNRGWFAENNVEVGDEIDIEEAAGEKDACYHKVKSRYSVWPSAYASGALVKCRKKGAANWGNKTKKEEVEVLENVSSGKSRLAKLGRVQSKTVGAVTNDEYAAKATKEKESNKAKDKAIADKTDVSKMSPFDALVAKKQAERKAEKARLKASGFKKMKREEFSNWRDTFIPTEYESIDLVKPEPLQPTEGIGSKMLDEKCWKGYTKKGMKTMFGKRYPNCVKKEEEELNLVSRTPLDEKKGCVHTHKGDECPVHGKKECPTLEKVDEAVRIPAKTGNIISTVFRFRSSTIMLKIFFPQTSVPKKSDVQDQIEKIYPGARLLTYMVSDYEPGQPILHAEGAAWTKSAGKNKEGGLNEKGRKSYEAENPGSDLKAPSKKKGNKRRASFCARMKGMKKKLTSAKTARDPDSRINKSLRAWNC